MDLSGLPAERCRFLAGIGRRSSVRALARRGRTGEDRQALLDEFLDIVLGPDVGDEQVGSQLRSQARRRTWPSVYRRSRPGTARNTR